MEGGSSIRKQPTLDPSGRTYSVSRHEQRLISAAQLVQESVGQFLTASPQFTYTVPHTLLFYAIKYTHTQTERTIK